MNLNATLVFVEVKAQLPAGTPSDLYLEAVAGYLSKMFSTATPPGFLVQLYVLSGLLALQLLLMLASVGLRIKMGNYWFMRMNRTSVGNYLTPNFTVSWQYLVIIFLVCLQIDCWFLVYFSEGVNFKGFWAMECIIWLGWWYSSILVVWSLVVSRAEMVSHEMSSRQLPFYLRPAFVHAVFPIYSLTGPVSLITWGCFNNAYYRRFYGGLTRAIYACLGAAQEANSLSATDFAAVEAGLVAKAQYSFEAFERFIYLYRATYIYEFVGTLLVYVLYLLVGVPSLVGLWRQLPRRDSVTATNKLATAKNVQQLRTSFNTAAATLALMTCLGFGYAGLTASIGIQHYTPSTFAPKSYATALVSLWLTGIIGIFACFVALHRSILQFKQHKRELSRPQSTGLNTAAVAQALSARSKRRNTTAGEWSASDSSRTGGGERFWADMVTVTMPTSGTTEEESNPIELEIKLDKRETAEEGTSVHGDV